LEAQQAEVSALGNGGERAQVGFPSTQHVQPAFSQPRAQHPGEQSWMSPIIIGVAGGSGSGKTTVSQAILDKVGVDRIAYIQHDSYYQDRSHLPPEQRAAMNFDHPDALESELLAQHLMLLQQGQAVEVPVYDFATYSRKQETRRVEPRPIILLEGILIFASKALRSLMHIKIYVDTDSDLRFIRRLRRDISERERSVDSVIQQYLDTVRPMHLEFVEPSKRYADVIIPEGGFNTTAIEMIVARVQAMVASEDG
jgi:uridine kinase